MAARFLAANAGTEFGRPHRFADIRASTTSAPRPDCPYDELRAIGLAAGSRHPDREPVIAFEETGGSTAGRKLIPYTRA